MLAAAPVGLAALLFPQGGEFPFRGSAVVWSLAAAAIVGLATAVPVVRSGAALYAAACIATFAVANPLGANLTRLGMFAAAPLVVLTARRVRVPLVAIAVAAMLWWQWSPALDGIVRAGRDPSSAVEYHLPLVAAVRRLDGSPARVEVVPTLRHWEAVYVASRLPLARGWERQLDMGRNAIFYDTALEPNTYHEWLREHAVQFVALPDVALDPSGALEARAGPRRRCRSSTSCGKTNTGGCIASSTPSRWSPARPGSCDWTRRASCSTSPRRRRCSCGCGGPTTGRSIEPGPSSRAPVAGQSSRSIDPVG